MRVLAPIPLADGASATVSIGNDAAGLLVANESSLSVQVNIGGISAWLPAWTVDLYDLSRVNSIGEATLTAQNLTSALNAPSSVALVTILQRGDTVAGTYPCALARQTNIGNGVVPTSGTNTLTNDGSALGTQIIETTPTGQSTSAFVLDNDGTLTVRTTDGGVWSVILSIAPGAGGGAATKLFHGTADNVPATGVGTGALPAGVTLGAAQLTSGTLPGAVTVPAANVSGTVANATQAANLGGIFFPQDTPANHYSFIKTQQIASSARDLLLQVWNGSAPINILILGDNATGVTALAQIDHTGNINAPSFSPNAGNGNFFCRGNFSGSASGTFSHGAGTTPNIVLLVDTTSGSSMTVGGTAYTSTQVTITLGTSGHTFKAVAM